MNKERIVPHYCDLCGCICVLCAQLQGCDECELLHPELLIDLNDFSQSLLDGIIKVSIRSDKNEK